MNELEKLREENKKLKEQIEKDKYNFLQREELAKNYLQLFGGYGDSGIKIPLDEEIKKAISKFLFEEMKALLKSDKNFEEQFIKMALGYKEYFIRIFKPVVKEIIEDLDFNVTFNSERE